MRLCQSVFGHQWRPPLFPGAARGAGYTPQPTRAACVASSGVDRVWGRAAWAVHGEWSSGASFLEWLERRVLAFYPRRLDGFNLVHNGVFHYWRWLYCETAASDATATATDATAKMVQTVCAAKMVQTVCGLEVRTSLSVARYSSERSHKWTRRTCWVNTHAGSLAHMSQCTLPNRMAVVGPRNGGAGDGSPVRLSNGNHTSSSLVLTQHARMVRTRSRSCRVSTAVGVEPWPTTCVGQRAITMSLEPTDSMACHWPCHMSCRRSRAITRCSCRSNDGSTLTGPTLNSGLVTNPPPVIR